MVEVAGCQWVMAGVEVEGRELSEGEEEEEGEEGEEGEVEKEEDTTGDGTNCEGSKENSPPAIGTKRPAQDAPTDVPDAKVYMTVYTLS